MPFFAVKNGRIESIKMEFNLVEGCNYSCSECSHFSPHLRAKRAVLQDFAADVNALKDVYRVRRFRFVGGEPLLHPEILSFVREVRASGITKTIEVVSNGSLLPRASDDLFREIDSLSISWYPDARCNQDTIDQASERCRRFGTRLKIKQVSEFRMMQMDQPIESPPLRRDIFTSCEIAHTWYCQTFYEGSFYLCSRPLFTDAYLQQKGVPSEHLALIDGVPLHQPDLLRRMAAYMSREEPLGSCNYCFGTVGRKLEWQQMTAAERRSPVPLARQVESSISRRRLRYLKAWAFTERGLWRVIPSLSLMRGLQLFKGVFLRG
jgi:Radical SAM superfamily/4Fe-4S single cluster domain